LLPCLFMYCGHEQMANLLLLLQNNVGDMLGSCKCILCPVVLLLCL